MIAGVAVSFLWRCMLLGTCLATAINAPGAAGKAVGLVGVGLFGTLLIQQVWRYLRGERL